MKTSEETLLGILADGRLHSGQQLADGLGVSRTAVWKHLDSLRDKGVDLKTIRGRGYQLAAPIELLDGADIRRPLKPATRNLLTALDVYYQLDSTSRMLRERLAGGPIHANVVLAEYQTGGRGRGGNQWLAAPGAGLCLSIGWHFDNAPKTLPALSLATGVVLADYLASAGSGVINLKWPNDLVHAGAKLGGILIESRGQLAGEVDVIVGIGINIEMPAAVARRIDQKVTDLSSVFGARPSRNRLAGGIIDHMFGLLRDYERHGFEAYIDRWRALDICRGREAMLHLAAGPVGGTVVDIDENGFLIMNVGGTTAKYSSGDLSLRIRG